MGYVGDVDLELVAAVRALADEDGVVKILGGFAVDGDDGEGAEVAAAGDFGGVEMSDGASFGEDGGVEMSDGASFGEDVFGKDAQELMLADRDFDVDAEVVGRTEDFNHTADGRARGSGPTGDFGIDDEALKAFLPKRRTCFFAEDAMLSEGLGRGNLGAGWNLDGLGHAVVEGNDEVLALAAIGAGVAKRADDGGVAALEDTNDAALHTTVGLGRVALHKHLVALHGGGDFVGRDEDVFVAGWLLGGSGPAIGADKAVAIAMQIEAAGDEVVARSSRAGKAPLLAIDLDKLSAGGDAGQLLEKQAALAAASEPKLANQLLVTGLPACGGGNAGDEFAVGHTPRLRQLRRCNDSRNGAAQDFAA
ncbi:hypothetical protein SBA5_250120 [Candidatus Sulfotelmatomonas gaucii]|uniref:Uncharacterized protein n=1 Tax=Candidatus Sulfuritelmatomonas gaucii TaxID=2043161 RepID=A0A2N9L9F2_9BACT|nr:hypothetical protein SBA5_250120 [Candidatus Sulfotelmatomonas gaucii]